jgi:hypothetical protein
MRKEPSSESEMVSQILFGEHFAVLDTKDGWIYVRHAFDDYEGWIDKRMYHEIPRDQKDTLDTELKYFAMDLTNMVSKNHSSFPVVLGSVFPEYDVTHQNFRLFPKGYHVLGSVTEVLPAEDIRSSLIETAFKYLNAPYLWGGRSPFGIDCSGFVQMVYRLNGYQLPRDASLQIERGRLVELEAAQPGDLAFFSGVEGSSSVTHVGIVLENSEIIHASGTVHVDTLDSRGIFCNQTHNYTHYLIGLRTII